MVEWLWRWVLKVNVRTVFLFAVLLLTLVLVGLARRGVRRSAHLSMAGHRVVAAAVTPPPAPVVRVAPRDIDDPFTSAFLMAWLDLEDSRRREREAARARDVAAAPVKPAVKVKPRPKTPTPKPPPKWISVIYQGMIRRTDGSCIAMVAEAGGGRLHTLKVGDPFLAARVKAITPGSVVLVHGAEEDEQSLKVGIVSRVRKDDA
ncbi:MAG: hypothetical protein HN919_20640 [Verrucomicrobia bacterium]|jgi:hypothetical protein|nr:hypothetical protein [Verrucomicrobiota bacterium]MBT7068714.1 hypothetical protein [Verrucomicrobiota bacterium]MBT7700996.1 hypothetical protein [Verrucomicrobiota bacterium]